MRNFQKILKQFYATFFEQSIGNSLSINDQAEISKGEQNGRIILLLSCLAMLLNIFGFLPTFIVLMSRTKEISKNSIIPMAGKSYS